VSLLASLDIAVSKVKGIVHIRLCFQRKYYGTGIPCPSLGFGSMDCIAGDRITECCFEEKLRKPLTDCVVDEYCIRPLIVFFPLKLEK
jgi:hypothetical protein